MRLLSRQVMHNPVLLHNCKSIFVELNYDVISDVFKMIMRLLLRQVVYDLPTDIEDYPEATFMKTRLITMRSKPDYVEFVLL